MPARDGAGWLLRLCPDAPTILIAIELAIIAYCLYAMFKHRGNRISGEEKILLWFVCVMLLCPVSLLIGISAWFATHSVIVGVGAAISSFTGLTALINPGGEGASHTATKESAMNDSKTNLVVVLYAVGDRFAGSRLGLNIDSGPQLQDLVELLEKTGYRRICEHCSSVHDEMVKRKYKVVKVTSVGRDWEGLSRAYEDRSWDIIATHPLYDTYNFLADVGADWSSIPETTFIIADLMELDEK